VFGADARVKAAQLLAIAIHAPQNGDKVIADFFAVIDTVRADGFAADELEKAKTGVLELNRLTRSQDGAVATQLTQDMLLGRTFQFQADQDAQIQATTLDQVNAAFRKYVDPSRIAVIWAGDEAKAKPPTPIKPTP